MNRTLKVLSALLTYPTAELQAAAPELCAAIEHDAALPPRERAALSRFIQRLAAADLIDLQERYVFLFDRTRSLSLHLFEHLHGESRDRGQAMVDLQDMYARSGLAIAARELPDYLPMFLEFLSVLPPAEARELLAQPLAIIAALRARLKKRRSPYVTVFLAIEALAAGKPDRTVVNALLGQADEDPDDFAALDALWEEQAVTFGPGPDAAAGCGPDRLAARLRAANRDAATPSSTGDRHA